MSWFEALSCVQSEIYRFKMKGRECSREKVHVKVHLSNVVRKVWIGCGPSVGIGP